MHRTQIQLRDDQARRLQALARARGLSLAELIRRYVDQGLQGDDDSSSAAALAYERAAGLIGSVDDPATDVAAEHDAYLVAAFSK